MRTVWIDAFPPSQVSYAFLLALLQGSVAGEMVFLSTLLAQDFIEFLSHVLLDCFEYNRYPNLCTCSTLFSGVRLHALVCATLLGLCFQY